MSTERTIKTAGLRNKTSSPAHKNGEPEGRRGPGRPSTGDAKKGNPDYKLTTVFLPKRVYANAQAKLLQANAERDQKRTVSDVLSEYLTQWVNE